MSPFSSLASCPSPMLRAAAAAEPCERVGRSGFRRHGKPSLCTIPVSPEKSNVPSIPPVVVLSRLWITAGCALVDETNPGMIDLIRLHSFCRDGREARRGRRQREMSCPAPQRGKLCIKAMPANAVSGGMAYYPWSVSSTTVGVTADHHEPHSMKIRKS